MRLAIKKNPAGFPYSFVYIKRALMANGGLKGKAGLTCVTFIVAVFEALSLPIVDTKTWTSRPEDDAFRKALLGEWANQGLADLSLLSSLYGETIPFRIKPLEIFGATAAPNYPVSFDDAKILAAEAAKAISNYKSPPSPAA